MEDDISLLEELPLPSTKRWKKRLPKICCSSIRKKKSKIFQSILLFSIFTIQIVFFAFFIYFVHDLETFNDKISVKVNEYLHFLNGTNIYLENLILILEDLQKCLDDSGICSTTAIIQENTLLGLIKNNTK